MIDFRDIRYVFQLPLEWFRAVNNRLFKAYGSNLVEVKEGEGGGLSIGVDQENFEKEVARIAAESGGSIGGSISFISSVTWNGSQIVIGHATATVSGGNFVVTPGANTFINTVTYSS